MTPLQKFVREIRDVARQQKRAVLAVDFEPNSEGLLLTFRFKRPPA